MGNNESIYWFFGAWILSAIFQIVIFIISSRRDKKNKILHEFYCEFYEYIKDQPIVTGLCHEMIKFSGSCVKDSEFIDSKKSKELKADFFFKHFNSQKPSIFVNSSFYFNEYFTGRAYWWRSNSAKGLEECTKQRKLFIKMLIEKTSSNKNCYYEIY